MSQLMCSVRREAKALCPRVRAPAAQDEAERSPFGVRLWQLIEYQVERRRHPQQADPLRVHNLGRKHTLVPSQKNSLHHQTAYSGMPIL